MAINQLKYKFAYKIIESNMNKFDDDEYVSLKIIAFLLIIFMNIKPLLS